ncbi:DMT family transporter [Amycolatopsis sp. H20-H5]|uniref:DMT family transporter n=1 Tax=Amycolatopsis sp. H20-H5 TaxID=3046309 RepID=UPI002DBB8851|nr:DMT family transporter [Amycolatopsis sp. H20-H5]MEC3981836.1 DMT family transporter [Amycolatopsis sp. H20-H5]
MSTLRSEDGRPSATHGSPSARVKTGILLAVASGVTMALQSRVNGRLGTGLHDSFLAAVVSFGGGLLVLTAALPFSTRMRDGLASVRRALLANTLRPWQCLGGIGGAMFVAGQSITVPVLGVALYTVGVVAGQTVSGLFVDRAGLGPAGPQPLTWPRVLGAVLTLGAVAGSLSGGLGAGGGQWWLFALPLVAGALTAVQQAVNGRVGEAAEGSAFSATWVNFAVGTAVLVLAWFVSLAVRGGPTAVPTNPVLYLGGLIGIVFIALASFVVRWIGVLLLGLAAIGGQLIGALLLDLFAPEPGAHVSTATLVGTAVALGAIAVAGLPFGGAKRALPE